MSDLYVLQLLAVLAASYLVSMIRAREIESCSELFTNTVAADMKLWSMTLTNCSCQINVYHSFLDFSSCHALSALKSSFHPGHLKR